MRERIATIAAAVLIGGIVGGLGLLLVIRSTAPVKLVNGFPLSYWTRAIQGDDASMRAAAAAALPQFGAQAIAPLIAMLDRPTVQVSAADVLAKFGATALPALVDVLDHGPQSRRMSALHALEGMSGPPTPVVLSAVARQLQDEAI